MLFNEDINSSHKLYNDSVIRFIDSRTEKLILDLLAPKAGERMLDVGCGMGDRLIVFRNMGCNVAGVVKSSSLVEPVRKKIDQKADIYIGRAEDLPFSDNEFDIVMMILTVDSIVDPQQAITEAIRVARDRVFLGFWNRYSLMNIRSQAHEFLFAVTGTGAIPFSGLIKTVRRVRKVLPGIPIQWGSVIFFPLGWYNLLTPLELHIPTRNNPFGAFLGVSFPVHISYRTIQQVIRDPLTVNSASRHALGEAARSQEAKEV